ncbi:MAG: regulatory protein GemA, partial [Pygmaiobacter sp.]
MSKAIMPWQIRTIYSKADVLGIKGTGGDDELHQLVTGITGKMSIKALDASEATAVISELDKRLPSSAGTPRAKKRPKFYTTTPGGVTPAQQDKIWALMFELKKFDLQSSEAALGGRLCGIIKRQFGMDAAVKQPFRFLSFEQGSELIEILKQYAYT